MKFAPYKKQIHKLAPVTLELTGKQAYIVREVLGDFDPAEYFDPENSPVFKSTDEAEKEYDRLMRKLKAAGAKAFDDFDSSSDNPNDKLAVFDAKGKEIASFPVRIDWKTNGFVVCVSKEEFIKKVPDGEYAMSFKGNTRLRICPKCQAKIVDSQSYNPVTDTWSVDTVCPDCREKP